MARYIFEVVLNPDEDGGYFVTTPDLPGCITEGDTVQESTAMAADALMTVVGAMMRYGDPIPDPTFGNEAPAGGQVVAISFETDASYVGDTVSPTEAAAMLGVSRGRVSQMIGSGILAATTDLGERRVFIDSINERLAAPRGTGRPRKELTAV